MKNRLKKDDTNGNNTIVVEKKIVDANKVIYHIYVISDLNVKNPLNK